MLEVKGNIWDYYDKGNWIVITTNGTVKANGEAVMGRGVALQAKTRFPDLPNIIGKYLSILGNIPIVYGGRLYTLPVKHNWYERADISLIEESCRRLVVMANLVPADKIYMVRPGCGNGGLDWENVKPILEKYLDDRFIVVERRN